MKSVKEFLVSTLEELMNAVNNQTNEVIRVKGIIKDSPSIRLSSGQQLVGEADSIIEFMKGTDGVEISMDNKIDNVTLIVEPSRRAIFNRPDVESLGTVSLKNIKTIGQVQLLANGSIPQVMLLLRM